MPSEGRCDPEGDAGVLKHSRGIPMLPDSRVAWSLMRRSGSPIPKSCNSPRAAKTVQLVLLRVQQKGKVRGDTTVVDRL